MLHVSLKKPAKGAGRAGHDANGRARYLAWLIIMLLVIALPACTSEPTRTTDQPKPWYKAKTKVQAPSAPEAEKPKPKEPENVLVAKPSADCVIIRTSQELDTCKAWAQNGDGHAAYLVGSAYEKGVRTNWLTLRRDTDQALRWHSMALDAGEKGSLRYLFNANYYGIRIPRNRKSAMEYLNQAAALKQDWALLILAGWAEKSDPEKSWGYYLTLAEQGNCHAMEKVAGFCMTNFARPANYTLAYFWGLAVDRLAYRTHSEIHQLWGRSATGSTLCGGSKVKAKAQAKLSDKYRSLAEREAAIWQPGGKEPYLPAPPPDQVASAAGDSNQRRVEQARQNRSSKSTWVGQISSNWKPINISQTGHYSQVLEPSTLFNAVSKSVWLVMAANSKSDMDRKRNLSIGSGVAVSENMLITNHHVVQGRFLFKVRQGKKVLDAQVLTSDRLTDRCVLLVGGGGLIAVRGYRPYDSLKVGEVVYTVGSPKGLENTLGQGLISGLRVNEKGIRMIQTTAQISKGSSGGGLFDRFGNLLGITTMTVKDSQSLNFAISVEDYMQ